MKVDQELFSQDNRQAIVGVEIVGEVVADLGANIVPHCTALGLQEQTLPGRQRSYEGTHRGRALTVTCGRRSKTKHAGEVRYQTYDGHRLSVNLGTTLKTRMVLGDKSRGGAVVSWLNGRMGVEKIDSLLPALDHLVIWAAEPSWVRPASLNPEVANMLVYLLPNRGEQSNARVSLGPGNFEFHLNTRAFSPEQVAYWVDAAIRLIEALESMAAPTKTMELKKLEVQIRDHPTKAAFMVLGGLFVVVILVSAVLISIAIGLIILTK